MICPARCQQAKPPVRYEAMTSPDQFRHISPRRLLRDRLKQLYFVFYKLGVRLGVYILPAHYYVSEPNIIELERTVDSGQSHHQWPECV
jgi:hypothetical protein